VPIADNCDVGEKAVAAARDGLDEAGVFGRISQRISDLADRLVEAMIEIHDRLWPKSTLHFFPGYELSGLFEQHRQQLEGLLLQP